MLFYHFPAGSRPCIAVRERGPGLFFHDRCGGEAMVRSLRLWSGLVLFTYVSCHLINHALGLGSLALLDAGREIFLLVWRNWPASVLLYTAFAVHIGLGLWSLYDRQSLRMPWVEALRLALGLTIPGLLLVHVLATRLAHELYGVNDSYIYVLLNDFYADPASGFQKLPLVLAVWLHGCIGLHYWLRLKPGYGPWQWTLYGLAVLLPTLALAGYWTAGRQVAALAQDAAWLAEAAGRINFAADEEVAFIRRLAGGLFWSFVAAGLLFAGLRPLREQFRRRLGRVQLRYPDGRRVTVPGGITILEASRRGGVPHASVCGGRGRCSTCRVRLGEGYLELPPPDKDERRVLARYNAAPNIRLACKTPALADLEVTPLLPPDVTPAELMGKVAPLQGQEREIAVLFADLRGFTSLSEDKLPFDVVFILNRYFAAMGAAVEASGGRVDKFIGDGVMALFGVDTEIGEASRSALNAAAQMTEGLDKLNVALASDLAVPLRMGIGIHSGHAIVGEMGYGHSVTVTAVGDTVNTASRLEGLTKEFGARLVVSAPLVARAGLDLPDARREEIAIRGRARPLEILVIEDLASLGLE